MLGMGVFGGGMGGGGDGLCRGGEGGAGRVKCECGCIEGRGLYFDSCFSGNWD